jgi:alpha-1,6-mannosyltransferase
VPLDDTYHFAAWRDANSAYGPAWEWMAAGTARLIGNDPGNPDNRNNSVIAFKLLACLGYLVTLGGVAWVLAKVAPERIAVGMLIFAWNPLMIYFSGGTGHNDLWLAATIVLAIGCTVRRWYAAAIVIAVLGTLIKFVPILLLPLLVIEVWRNQPMRARLETLLSGGVMGGLLILIVYRPFWTGIASLGVTRRENMFTSSLGALLRQALQPFFSTGAGTIVAGTALVAFGAFTLWQLWQFSRTPASEPLGSTRALLRILLFYLLIAAIWFQHWYLAWVIPLAALLDESPLRRITLVFSYMVTWQPLLYNYVTLRYDGWIAAPWRDLIPVSVFMGGTYLYILAEWRLGERLRKAGDNPVPPSRMVES